MNSRLPLFLLFAFALTSAIAPAVAQQAAPEQADKKERSNKSRPLDRSGKTRTGEASFYADKFAGRTMADGTPMDPESNVAASRTLPLGTKAKVTRLDNGKSAVVDIRDRGPYIDGRIVDVSPKVAEKLGMTEEGVAPVAVTPLDLPEPKVSTKRDDSNAKLAEQEDH